MPLPKLSPLQSRLAASLIASIMLLMLYFTFSSPHFAYAADVDSIRPEDHNHEPILETPFLEEELELEVTYMPEFLGVDRGIVGRQANADDPTPMMNNVVAKTNVEQGKLLSYVFTNTSLLGDKSPETPGLPSPIRVAVRDLVKEEEEEEEEAEEVVDQDVGDRKSVV